VGRLWSTRLYREAYSLDFPQRHFWRAQSRKPGDERSACANLLYSTHDPSTAVECLATTPEAQKPALRAHIATRFHGSPRAAGIEMPPASGDADRVVQLRAAIDSDPAHWPNYQQLGVLLLQGGLYEEAQQMYLGWPDFKTAEPGSALGSSNAAYESGSELYWRGRPELARPLYEIAAKLRTGSSASMTSELRLALLDGDFEAAVQGSLERGSRYPNAYAFRDYFSLLYVLGRARDAEAGFSQVASDFDNPQMWSAQLVGHRMRGMTVNQLKAWILEPGVRDAHRFGRRFAGTYLLWWATTDRKLSPDVVELVGQVEHDAVRTIDTDGVTLRRPNTQGDGNERLAASTFRKGQSPRLAPETRVKSELVLFADALASVHAADYPSAVTKFVALADRYPIEHGEMQASLSYFALAAAKTGDKLGLERYIESLPETQGFPAADRTFDMWLARAYFAVVRREFAKADEALRRAFNSRPHTDVRPVFSEYQFAEACEFALRESGDQRFSRRMLDWAKRHQQIQPTQAWAYAIEAQYSKIPADAERALAMALYLDPASPRLAKIDAARRAGARAWLQKHNPFLVRPEPMRQRTAGGG
jgi:tetratricopeptide (TPR) repeat protein